ncbi:hypothetical protein HYX01_01340 [Candidatus Woesearchaeota archaeon]|nr:hypothetical protein [Candidatus Woesearchaeota archaeon]
MKIINDVVKHGKIIKSSIKKYGFFAEHNYMHYLYNESSANKNVFFGFNRGKGILAQVNAESNAWSLFPNGILAPESERIDLLLESINYILKTQNAKKFAVELSEDIRKSLLSALNKENNFRACSTSCILYWPVYSMKMWDSRLEGRKWKKLRNIKNRFYRKNNVEVADSRKVSKDELLSILKSWINKRIGNDSVKKSYYTSLINNNFEGADIAKTLHVNGKPCTITAGWKIPNSNNYYSAVGILDYSYHGLGEIANIDDLDRLKKNDYEHVDFGGSGKTLLYFKKKFKPDKIYKTYIFSIVRK